MIKEIQRRDTIVEPETELKEDKEIVEQLFTDKRINIRYIHLEYKYTRIKCPYQRREHSYLRNIDPIDVNREISLE